MNLKSTLCVRRQLHDFVLWILLITSLCFLSSSNLLSQCNCNDELVTTTSINSSEGFESYTANQLIPLGGNWSLYPSGNPKAATVVTSPVNCGSKSLKFQFNGGQDVDMNYLINEKRTSFKMYIPSGKKAQFSYLLGNGETPHFNIDFDSGNGEMSNGETFTYPQATWFRFSIIKVNNEFKFFVNYDHIATVGSISVAAYANFYSYDVNEIFYIDKLCNYFNNGNLVNCTQEFNPQCLNESGDEAGNNPCQARTPGYIDLEFSACGGSGFSPCDDATTISCGQTISGTTIGENFKFYRPDYVSCMGSGSTNDYQAPDKVYKFNHAGGGDVSIHLWTQTPNVDLDVFLISECGNAWSSNPELYIVNIPPNTSNPNITCIGRGISHIDPSGYDNDYINVKDLPAGTYYIVIDGQHWQSPSTPNDVGSFQLSLHCKDLSCANATSIKCGDKLTNQSNTSGDNNVSIYCSPSPNVGGNEDPLPPGTGCTGKERVYKFTPDVNGTVELNVTKIDPNEDFEVFVFLSCDQTNCLASGTNTYGQSEYVTFDGEKGREYIIVVDGYQGTSGTYDIEIKCANKKFCDICMQCFKQRPRFNSNNVVEFFSGWCDAMPVKNASAYTNVWSVENTTVSYLDNTNNTSFDPIISFPGNGRYRVCQKIYSGSTLVYECCQWVEINPCNGEPKAYFSASYDANTGQYTIDANGSQNASNIEWQFSESGVSFASGNNTSSVSKINIPNGRCINVCIYVYNGCGLSTYCVTLCKNSSSCTGNLPTPLFSSVPQPVLDGRKLTYSAPQLTNAEYIWDLGDGSAQVTGRSINYTYAKDGNYIVCLRVIVGCRIYCYCWCVRPRLCPPIFEGPASMVTYQFTGTASDPKYTINTQNISVAPNEDWLLNGNPLANSKNKATMQVSLPSLVDYTVCIPYLKSNGCIAYKCIVLRGGNPFDCQSILWSYVPNQGYQFQLPSGNTEIQWTVDETGQSLGNGSSSSFLPPPSNCVYRTISVKYFDGIRYIICCLRIYICDPVNCRSNVKYYNQNDQARFELAEAGASNISWFFDDQASTILSSNPGFSIPYPSNCFARTISVRYKDAQGNWRICCLVIYWCNPSNCESSINFTPDGNNLTLSTSASYQDVEWFIDDIAVGQGNSISIVPPSNGQKAYVKYKNPITGCIYICCKKLPSSGNALTLELAKNICSNTGNEVLVPITVKNYKNVAGIQFNISSSTISVAEIAGATNYHPSSGIKASDFTVVNNQLVFFTDGDLVPRTLADGEKLFDVRVKIKGSLGQSANIVFSGDIKAFDQNVTSIPLATINGSVCVQNSLIISGKVTNTAGKPLPPESAVTLKSIFSKNLDNNGNFVFDGQISSGNNYTIYPVYAESLIKGVDVADLLLLRRHMQGIATFIDPYRYYAADLNDDKQIDVADLLTMRRIMQGLTTELPNDRFAWKFVTSDYVFPSTGNPLAGNIPTERSYTPLTQSQTNQNFIGVKRGDLNHSTIPFTDIDVENRSANMSMKIGDVSGNTGDIVEVDISVKDFSNILGLGMSLEWPINKLELLNIPGTSDIKIAGTTLFNETLLSQGKLGLFWESNDLGSGTTLANGTVVYKLKFKILAPSGQQAVISGSSIPVTSKYIDAQGNDISLTISAGTVNVGTSSTDENEIGKISIFPNPTTSTIHIESSLDIQSITVIDVYGREVGRFGNYHHIDLSHLKGGTYLIRLKTMKGDIAKPIIVIK